MPDRLAVRLRPFRIALCAIAIGAGPFQAEGGAPSAGDRDGTVRVSQVSIAFFVGGQVGGGVLTYKGREHRFEIGGMGVGGLGASKMEATGSVYHLDRLEDFQGAYAQARYGAVAGSEAVEGALWLTNAAGVVIELAPKREGAQLSLGGDAVYIVLK